MNPSTDDDFNEYFQLLSCFDQSNTLLHEFTDLKLDTFCERLLHLFRDASISKIHSQRFLSLIYSGLPIANTMPRTMQDLLVQMNGKKRVETHPQAFNTHGAEKVD